MKILTIKNIINVKNSLHVTLKKLFVKKNYIYEKFVCVTLENLKIFIEKCVETGLDKL